MTAKSISESVKRLRQRCNCNSDNPCGADEDCQLDREAASALESQAAEIARLTEDNASLQATFDLRWNADMRAIKKWQAAGEGRELTWPDHADLCLYLLGEIDRLMAEPKS